METDYHKMRLRSGKLVYVHRYIAGKILGHPLGKNQIVHHINGNKLDNRRSNLKIESLEDHTRNHVRHGDYHHLTKAEMRRGAYTTNHMKW